MHFESLYYLKWIIFLEEENFVDDNNNEKMTTYSQQVGEMGTECKSPCSSTAEMCIEICA